MAATTHTFRLPTDSASAEEWEAFGIELVDVLGRLGVKGGDAFDVKATVLVDDLGHRFDELPKPKSQRGRILLYAVERGFRGLTADEATFDLEIPSQSCRPRLVELRRGGWVHETERRRVSEADSTLPVFVATAKAYGALGIDLPRKAAA